MSHPHAASVPAPDFSGQAKTLFLTASKSRLAAMLVTHHQGKMSSRAMRFPTPHAALDWCLAHDAGLVMTRAEDPARN
jgi:hypothetical protein